jgi:hypothetical protein
VIAKPPDTGSGIDDDDIVVVGPDLNTGRISAVFDILFAGYRY